WIHATPAPIFDSLVSIGSYDGNMYVFNENGVLQTQFKPGGIIFTNTVQADSSTLVFGTNKGVVKFYNFFDETYTDFFTKKRMTHGSPVLLSNNSIAIGSNDKFLYILNKDGLMQNKFKTNGWIMHSKPLEVANELISFGSYDKHLYTITKDAELVWKFAAKGKIHASPRLTQEGNIVFGSFDKHI